MGAACMWEPGTQWPLGACDGTLGFWRPRPFSAQSWQCCGCSWLTLPWALPKFGLKHIFCVTQEVGNEGGCPGHRLYGVPRTHQASRAPTAVEVQCGAWEALATAQPRLAEAVFTGPGPAPAQFAWLPCSLVAVLVLLCWLACTGSPCRGPLLG